MVGTDQLESISACIAAHQDPYPFYANKRKTQPVFRGSVPNKLAVTFRHKR